MGRRVCIFTYVDGLKLMIGKYMNHTIHGSWNGAIMVP